MRGGAHSVVQCCTAGRRERERRSLDSDLDGIEEAVWIGIGIGEVDWGLGVGSRRPNCVKFLFR